MAPSATTLEPQDWERDAAFKQALHGKTAEERNSFMAMLKKDPKAQKAAVDEYFKHWDNKDSKDETPEIREVSISTSPRALAQLGMQSCIADNSGLHRQDVPNTPLSQDIITTSQPTCTSMAGPSPSTSAALRTARLSNRPSHATSIISRSR